MPVTIARWLLLGCLCLTAAGGLTACATGLGGSAAPRYGHVDGIYRPTPEEQSLDCKQLAFAVNKSIQQINAMPAVAAAQQAGPPDNLTRVAHRIAGHGPPVLEDFDREYRRVGTIAALLPAKSCPPIDVAGQTKAAADQLNAMRSP